ncbi:Uncharacterized protein SCF082_LOCUS19682, partial [Durusdinium trenchii]
DLKQVLWWVAFCMSLLMMILSFAALVLISTRQYGTWWQFKRFVWRCIHKLPLRGQRSNTLASKGSSGVVEVNSKDRSSWRDSMLSSKAARLPPIARVLRIKIQFQNLLSFGVVLMFFCSGMALAVYEGLQLNGVSRAEESPAVHLADFSLASTTTLFFLGLWLVAFKWYDSLPNLRRVGRLFEVNSLLIQNPNAFKHWCRFCSLLTGAFLNALFWVVPLIDPNLRDRANRISFFAMLVALAVWLLSMILLVSLLLSVFSKSHRFLSDHEAAFELSDTKPPSGRGRSNTGGTVSSMGSFGSPETLFSQEYHRMKVTLGCTLLWTVVLGLFGCALLLGTLFLEPFMRNIYVVFSGLAIAGSAGSMILLYYVIFRPIVPCC